MNDAGTSAAGGFDAGREEASAKMEGEKEEDKLCRAPCLPRAHKSAVSEEVVSENWRVECWEYECFVCA